MVMSGERVIAGPVAVGHSFTSPGDQGPPGQRGSAGEESEYFLHTFAGSKAGDALPTVSTSGHPLVWTRTPDEFNSALLGVITPNRGAFYTVPREVPSAGYAVGEVEEIPRWVRGQFSIIQNATLDGAFCLGLSDRSVISSSARVAADYRHTPSGWVFAILDSQGEHILAQGDYAPQLIINAPRPPTYSVSIQFVENPETNAFDTAIFKTADGFVHKVVDPRIDTYAGPHIFAKSHAPQGTSCVVGITSFEGGSKPPTGLIV